MALSTEASEQGRLMPQHTSLEQNVVATTIRVDAAGPETASPLMTQGAAEPAGRMHVIDSDPRVSEAFVEGKILRGPFGINDDDAPTSEPDRRRDHGPYGEDGRFLGEPELSQGALGRTGFETLTQERQDLYRQIVQAHTDPICRFLPDGTLTFVNASFCTFFDGTEDELMGTNVLEFMSTAQRLEILRQVSLLTPAEPVFSYEHRITVAPGEFRWIKWTARGIFDAQGTMYEVQSVARDVTGRKLAEIALKKSEARYSNLIKAIPDGVVLYDPQGQVTYVNDGFTELYGWTSADIMGRPISFVPPGELPRTLAAWEKTFRGERVLLETKRTTKDGTILDVQLRTAILRDRFGNVSESIVIHRDITERKRAQEALQNAHDELELHVQERTAELAHANEQLRQEILDREQAVAALAESEERFRAIFETAQDCIFLKDRDLRYTHVNPAYLRVLELREPEVIGRTVDDIFSAQEAGYVRDLEDRVLSGQVIEATYNLTTHEWPRTFHCVRVPLRSSSGETTGVCGIARDITDRKALERRCVRPRGRYASALMEFILEQTRLAAQSESIVLLLGESGSGKDFLSKYLHDHSRRDGGPYFAINCAALAASLAESELFGHEPGSFTGSRGRKRGLLEMAEGGTLLLNEVGELSLELQAKLLTFLDTHTITRVGGDKTIKVNARIVAATNRDLEREVGAGRFREDLFYRINVFAIRVPPLRERMEDLPMLARDILEGLSIKLGWTVPPMLEGAAVEALSGYQWPGNVRELRNVLERALILCRGNTIRAEDISLPKKKGAERPNDAEIPVTVSVSRDCPMNEALEAAKRLMVLSALRRCRGNVSAAARVLGVSRDAMRYHIKALDIDR